MLKHNLVVHHHQYHSAQEKWWPSPSKKEKARLLKFVFKFTFLGELRSSTPERQHRNKESSVVIHGRNYCGQNERTD